MAKIKFLEGNLEMDYTRSPGKVIGRFLSELRDNQEIMGIRDSKTSQVFVPPQLYGPDSKSKMQTYVPMPSEGTIAYFTVVKENLPFSDWPAPFTFVGVKFDGSHSVLWHRMKATEGLEIGQAVKPVYRDEEKREGSILDIDYFEPV